jgi:hypothetical protein
MYSVWLRTGRPGDRGSIPGRSPLCPDRLWGPPSILYNGYRGSFPPGRGVTLNTHPHLVPRSWMSRSCIPLPPSASMACSGTVFLFLLISDSRPASRSATCYLLIELVQVDNTNLTEGHSKVLKPSDADCDILTMTSDIKTTMNTLTSRGDNSIQIQKAVLWDAAPLSMVDVDRREGTFCLHDQVNLSAVMMFGIILLLLLIILFMFVVYFKTLSR